MKFNAVPSIGTWVPDRIFLIGGGKTPFLVDATRLTRMLFGGLANASIDCVILIIIERIGSHTGCGSAVDMRAAAVALLWITGAFGLASSPPRHIIFFLVDDLGFADASYKSELYNGTGAPPTPTLDKFAADGVKLESYYVNKLCSPTRTALLSGRYAYTNGMDDGVIIDGQNIDMPLNLLTIADHLKSGGLRESLT